MGRRLLLLAKLNLTCLPKNSSKKKVTRGMLSFVFGFYCAAFCASVKTHHNSELK